MPERNHEVIIDGFVFPDTVTVTLANDEYINSRDYVDKELYESVSSANDYWQAENAKLLHDLEEANNQAEEVCIENAKLREERNRWHVEQVHAYSNWEDVHKRATEFELENAKLRELVADMWFWHYEGHIDSESQERQMLHIDAVIQRMRELGVVVDE